MNKFNFISNEIPVHHATNTAVIEETKETTKEFRQFQLDFSGTAKGYEPIFEGRRVQPIIKSDIQESLKLQLKDIIKQISEKEEIAFFKMNSQTKNKFRTFLGYETDYVRRDEKNKKVVGNIFGIPILLDEKIVDFAIVALVRFKTILKTDFLTKETV